MFAWTNPKPFLALEVTCASGFEPEGRGWLEHPPSKRTVRGSPRAANGSLGGGLGFALLTIQSNDYAPPRDF